MAATVTRDRRRFDVATTTLAFESEDRTCRGRLYRPARPATPPVIVLGPTFAAEGTFGYPRYAERFARAGYAAFVFDYGGFGESDDLAPAGRFRSHGATNLVDPDTQVADWHAAIDRVRRLDGERRRVVLWGFGLGGGHAVRVAANRRVDGVVAVAPMLDGRAFARARSPRYLARAVGAGLRDRLTAPLGRGHTVPVVGGYDEFGVLPKPTGDAYLDLVPPESDWRNETSARGLLALFRYRPLADAEDVTCPTLLVAAGDDELAPADTVADAADRIDRSTYLRLPVGHVDALGSAFETAASHQLAFLDDLLGV
ncbi:alpha/beta hydrolase [Haloplanus aerogenes]|uniref:Alpha/beta fold hydrolase n=1 Tax=Haloplanus aerogenes TaxID=660522 RepID=A0A3M0DA93_9EURY|nr:alpha/beta fold hydrolase [Haloplanus aerogenes]AZH26245.1 alpha/beta fold hydrolase [Haloplanus aerogenes]RMB18297.1 serine aminopeptidase S33 family [Haloplanus aerogenes]